MRVMGIKLVPLLVAVVAVYVIGMLIYGLLFSEQWMAWSGKTEDSFKGHEWRMALSPIMPVMIVLGLGALIKDRGINTWMAGARMGAFVGLFFLVASRMYNFAYGTEPVALLVLDSAHLLLNGIVGGAVLGAMKATD
jgi:Protein of unknown function (DUF1761)